MFAGLDPIRQYTARRWTATASFTVQVAIIAAALVIPLLKPQSLPEAFIRRPIFVPASGEDVRTTPNRATGQSSGAAHMQPLVVNRTSFSFRPTQGPTAATESPQAPGLPGLIGIGSGVPNSIMNNVVRLMPHPVATIRPPRVSVMMQGNLVHRVEPQYPAIARQLGIQGTVVIRAFISRAGTIERTELVSGHPMLAHAALEAVQQWKYRPYYLNSEPVEVETQITVNFVLNR